MLVLVLVLFKRDLDSVDVELKPERVNLIGCSNTVTDMLTTLPIPLSTRKIFLRPLKAPDNPYPPIKGAIY